LTLATIHNAHSSNSWLPEFLQSFHEEKQAVFLDGQVSLKQIAVQLPTLHTQESQN
jgi:hypothetical protein